MSDQKTLPAPKQGILDISPYAGGKSGVPGVAEIIKLSSNESALGTSDLAIKAYVAAGKSLHRYPDGGSLALRQAIGKRFGLDPARIVCGNGSDDILALLARAYAGPGDEVLSTEHGFLMYAISARIAGAVPKVAMEKNLKADVDEILGKITPATKIVFLANPGNPTGSYLCRDELTRLCQGLPAHVLLVIDGAYAEYVGKSDYESGAALVNAFDNVVMTRTFSKIFGLGALRLGWAYASAGVTDILNRVRGPFNVNGAAQAAGIAALEDTAFIEKARDHNNKWRKWTGEKLEQLGLTVYPSVANFLLVHLPEDDVHDANRAEAFLAAQGILVRKVDNYGLPECLRITIGTQTQMERLCAALNDFMND